MAAQKKFGTFSGVLTPSLLTILGVIMYMRLGSVVGNSSGIFQVLIIIVFAHLISITTGLSVSSIATDKKIEKGGIYYMLTRSLGLPIGGAIGLTIFIATAFSISLYLIGFAESLIPVLDESFGLGDISINKLRIFGTIALCLVMIIAYVSTSFALKIQYVILGLIVLSLFSVFLGSSEGLKVGTDVIEAPSFSVLFGIFFPAVTGFTAGVAMSGDLKNPRLSIPWGTMLSITIGLIVYIILAIFIFYNIDAEILKTNNNVLIEFGAVSVLVLGGVWGATLSSALGGILGGPRILQAMSIDKITPKVFSKGYGLNNEPRNALILTFFIAELGILIGELNVIAELVAMFYMAAYLFINISCFLEQWSSPDFRPKFKIPIWISLLGAVATFFLMIQLNLAATLFAILIMLLIWFWLSKKDLVLGTGDVWFGVWTSIVKTGLKNLQKKAVHRRNWQPNILLFSGGTKNRPHLIEFGKSISGRGGMVSNFDLIEAKDSDALFPKPHQVVKDNQIKDDSIFHRRLYCKNIFKGIETIANTYGFSGIDPNTVLMGWARNTKDPIYFGQMTQKLKELDYNILYLDYDSKRGFGSYSEISIWWSEINKENELGLQLVKFLKSSTMWKNAELNINYVNNQDVSSNVLNEEIAFILDKKRIRANVKVINNVIEKKSINDLIKSRSYSSDLILMNLPSLINGKEKNFIKASNELFYDVGSALFIEASSNFKLLQVKESVSKTIVPDEAQIIVDGKSSPDLIKTFDLKFDSNNLKWQKELMSFNETLCRDFKNSISSLLNFYNKTYDNTSLKDELVNNLYNTQELHLICEDLENNFNNNIEDYFSSINDFISSNDSSYNFVYTSNFLKNEAFSEISKTKIFDKRNNRLSIKNSSIEEKINVFKLLDFRLKNNFTEQFYQTLKLFGEVQLKLFHEYKSFINQTTLKSLQPSIAKLRDDFLNKFKIELDELIAKLLNGLVVDIVNNNVKRLNSEREEEFDPKIYRKKWQFIEEFGYSASKNSMIFHNHKVMSCTSSLIRAKVLEELDALENLIHHNTFDYFSHNISQINKEINLKKTDFNKLSYNLERSLSKSIKDLDKFDLSDLIDLEIEQFPIELDVYYPEIINDFSNKQDDVLEKEYYLQATLKSIYYQGLNTKVKFLINTNRDCIRKDIEDLISTIKLLGFTIDNQKDNDLVKEVREKLKIKIHDLNNNISNYKERLLVEINDLRTYSNKLLDEQFLLESNSKRVVEPLKQEKSGFIAKLYNLQYTLSDSFLKLIKFITPEENTISQNLKLDKVIEIRNFINQSSMNPLIERNISQLYLQLFNYKIQPNAFFSSFISSQLISLKQSIEKPILKNKNVIIVTGDPQSGKSYLINQFLDTCKDKDCFSVDPPLDFTLKPVEKRIKPLIHQINASSSRSVDFNSMKDGSLVLILDFELWWRKNKDGYYSVESWIKLFKKYKNLTFIIEVNQLLIEHLLSNTELNNCIMKLINTTYFSSKQLLEITDQKSKMSDQFIYSSSNKVNFKKINKLISGNIGWFNSFWLSSIQINNDQCEINPNYELVFPSVLSDLEITVLLNFYWHKRINIDHIEAYFSFLNINKLNETLSFLKSEKLIILNGNSMELNFFITPYLKKYFLINNYIA